jgi:hypothetical protein
VKVWVKTTVAPEGKYLVVRRDGTIPHWPHFVLGGDDPNSPAALNAYADQAAMNGLDFDYVASIRELSDDFQRRVDAIARGEIKGKADPDAPPHRRDNPAIISAMRGERELTDYTVLVTFLGMVAKMRHFQELGIASEQRTEAEKAVDEILYEMSH